MHARPVFRLIHMEPATPVRRGPSIVRAATSDACLVNKSRLVAGRFTLLKMAVGVVVGGGACSFGIIVWSINGSNKPSYSLRPEILIIKMNKSGCI